MINRILFCAVFALLAAPAFAQDISYKTLDEQALRDCLFIEDNQLRLRCFDDATGRSEVSPNGQAAPELVAPMDGGLLLYKQATDASLSWLDRRWELSPSSKRGRFEIRPYQPVYILPIYHNAKPNDRPTSPNVANQVGVNQNLDQNEAKFQLSLKTKLVENLVGDNGDVWFGYTQSSRWQVYNEELSKPFRETNYEPELAMIWRTSWSDFTNVTGWKPRLLGLSLNHQSNGRELPFSRSWNRVIGMIGLERENTMFQIRPWVRLPEDEAKDDNSDIQEYMGRADFLLVHKYEGHEFSLLGRHNFRNGDQSRGAAQFDWAFPISNSLRGHMQFFTGYGESLIDYNHRSDYLGLGVSLVGWY